MADADFGDFLDYLAGDTASRAILLYMEQVTQRAEVHVGGARAPRAPSRSSWSRRGATPPAPRPPLRTPARWRARMRPTTPRSGGPACCACASSTTCSAPPRSWRAHPQLAGDRLAILTNGGGAGVLAADRARRPQRHARRALRRPRDRALDAVAAADVVARQSRRHHRRCRPGSDTRAPCERCSATRRPMRSWS